MALLSLCLFPSIANDREIRTEKSNEEWKGKRYARILKTVRPNGKF